MSRTALNWRYVGAQSFGSATVAAALDACFALGALTTYADGTSRTPGSGSAWTWARYQNGGVTEAWYGTPPTDTLSGRVMLCGQATTAKTPTLLTPDTANAANIIQVGVNKNSGAFLAWDNASPFTSGQFSGLWRMWPTSAGTGTAYLWESQTAVIVVLATTGGAVYAALLGDWLDPESSDTSVDAESDGALYGMSVSGSGAAMAAAWWGQSGTADWLDHNTTQGQSHTGTFTPGASTWVTASVALIPGTAMTSSGLKTRSGRWARHALALRATAAAPNDNVLGRLRELFAFADAQMPAKQSSGGTTIGYVVSASTASTADALLLLH